MRVENSNPYVFHIQIDKLVEAQQARAKQAISEGIGQYLAKAEQRHEEIRQQESEQWLKHCLNVKV